MDCSKVHLDRIEAQRSTNASHDQQRRRSFPMYLINNRLCSLSSQDSLQAGGESMAEFFINLRFTDLFDLPGEYVPMIPDMFSAWSDGNKEWLEKLRSHGTPLACFKNDRGDYILHLAATWGHRELVKNIVSECTCLLLEPNSKEQLPIHVAARAGHSTVVEAFVRTVTFVSAKLSDEEERERLNLYILKGIDGHIALHLALKGRYTKTASSLVTANQQASFLANKDGISPLYLAVEAGDVSLVKEMLGMMAMKGEILN